jgi:RNA-directed DNA polymerase
MMHELEKSDPSEVARKLANDVEGPSAEPVERREGAKGSTNKTRTRRTPSRESVSLGLARVRERARQQKKERFTALLHHVDIDLLRTAFFWLKRDAAPGVDGLTWREYEQTLEVRLVDLHARVHSGAYQAWPSRRKFIPKGNGQRPLGVAALEDKIVQRAVVEVLNAVYEEAFLGFSYGFRPGRSQHDALDAVAFGITRMKVNYILECDIRGFFDSLSHEWLGRFIEHRIGDPRILRLIRKWLTAGVLEDGKWKATDVGSPQGSVISPVLANIFLHHCFDHWADRWRRRNARGEVLYVRYADDILAAFEYKEDAQRFLAEMRQRLEQFKLTLHPEKTRLVEFGRFAAENRSKRGLSKPETFTFLGFVHISGRTRTGRFQLRRKTRRDRMRAKLKAIREELRRRMHEPIPEQGRWLGQVVRGYFAYHAVPTNFKSLMVFRDHVRFLWKRILRKRSQTDRTTWARVNRLADDFLPTPKILHPWPSDRFLVKHPRWKPSA